MTQAEFDLSKTALIVIDMQNAIIKDRNGFFQGVYNMVRSRHVIENMTRLVEEMRAIGVPIFFVKVQHRRDGTDIWPKFTSDFIISGLEPTPEGDVVAMGEGTPGAEFIDELKPLPGDYVIVKRGWSAFYGTDLELLLRRVNIDTLLLAGVVTGGCVESTARSAVERDFNVIFVKDCCADLTEEIHELTVSNSFRRLGRVTTSVELIKAVRRK